MTNQEYSFIEGFVKRASEYGYNEIEAIEMLKSASPETLAMSPGALTAAQAGQGPVHPVASPPPVGVSAISPEMAKKLRIPSSPADAAYYGAPTQPKAPPVTAPYLNEAMMQPGQRSFTSPR